MATYQELINIIRDMTRPGLEVGLHTLKACVLTKDRGLVERIAQDMIDAGELTETKKHRYKKNN